MSSKAYLDPRRSPFNQSLYDIYLSLSDPSITGTLTLQVQAQQLVRMGEQIGEFKQDLSEMVSCLVAPVSGTVCAVGMATGVGVGGKPVQVFTIRACEHFPRDKNQGLAETGLPNKSILHTADICTHCGQQLWMYYQSKQLQLSYRELKRSFQHFSLSQLDWKLVLNEPFTKDTEIASTSEQSYCLPFGGKVTFMYQFAENEPPADTVVLRYRKVVCKHEKIASGMCVFCLIDVKELKDVNFRRYLFQFDELNYDANLIVTGQSLEAQALKFKNQLIKQKKCLLVLDLDNTILHSISLKKVDQQMINSIDQYAIIPPEDNTSFFVEKTLVKFRPNFRYFLEKMVELFQIFIYTKGTRAYAEEICRVVRQNYGAIVGQTKNFLPHRIISRDEDPNLQKKNLDYLIPKNRDFMLILDDRRDVWNHSSLCVFTRPYIFFYYVQITSDGKTKLQPVQWQKGGGSLEHKLNEFEQKCLKEIEEAEISGKEDVAVQKIQELEQEIVESEKNQHEDKIVVCVPESSLQANPKEAIQIKQQIKQLVLNKKITEQQKSNILRNNSNSPDQYLITTSFGLKQAHTLYFDKIALPDNEVKKQGQFADLCHCFQEYKKSLLSHMTIAFVSIIKDYKKLGCYRRAQRLGVKIVDSLSDPTNIDIIVRPNNFGIGYPETSAQLAQKYYQQAIRKMKSTSTVRKVPIVSETWIDVCYEYNCFVHYRYFEPQEPYAKVIFGTQSDLRKVIGDSTVDIGEKIKEVFKEDGDFQSTSLNR